MLATAILQAVRPDDPFWQRPQATQTDRQKLYIEASALDDPFWLKPQTTQTDPQKLYIEASAVEAQNLNFSQKLHLVQKAKLILARTTSLPKIGKLNLLTEYVEDQYDVTLTYKSNLHWKLWCFSKTQKETTKNEHKCQHIPSQINFRLILTSSGLAI